MNLALRSIDEPAAQAIVSGDCPSGLSCAADFPAESDRIAAGMFLQRLAADLDPRPFGGFLVVLVDRVGKNPPFAIGGIGFHGGPDDHGQVEIGYGIVASEQGRGYATRALALVIERARELGAASLMAEVDPANGASRRVLARCGFVSAESNSTRFVCAL